MNFDWKTAYPSTRVPVFARNVVSTSHPLAAQAGLRMLQQGGNAVDAAIAAAAAMTIVEPCSNGLGSRRLLHPVGRQEAARPERLGPGAGGLDAGVLPQQVRRRRRRRRRARLGLGHRARRRRRLGRAVRALRQAAVRRPAGAGHRDRRARLRGADRRPAEVGRGGAAAAARSRAWRRPSCRGAAPPEVGELFALPGRGARAAGDRRDARRGASTAARSPQARRAFARRNGGAIEASDFAAFKPEWVEPIGIDYRGHRLHEIPPNGQGIAALIALGILRHFDLASLPVDGAESQHLQIEAMKLAFADAYRYVADPRSMDVTPEQMLDDAYLAGARAPDRPEAGAGLRRRQPGQGRHDLPHRGRRERHDGELHPEQLHGLRLGRRRARARHQPAEPRPRLQPRPGSPNVRGARQAARSTPSSRPS